MREGLPYGLPILSRLTSHLFFLFDAQKGHSTTNWDTAERHEKHGDDKEINSRTNA
jgi:hypothetical protein